MIKPIIEFFQFSSILHEEKNNSLMGKIAENDLSHRFGGANKI